MKTRIPSLSFFLLFLSLTACRDKGTVVHGKVVDKVTGEGLDSVAVTIIEFDRLNEAPYTRNLQEHIIFTNQEGQFSFSSDHMSLGIGQAIKPNYLYKGDFLTPINDHQVNEIEFSMVPMDGVLSLTIHNTTDKDTIYLGVYSPAYEKEFALAEGILFAKPILVPSMDSRVVPPIKINSEEEVTLYSGLIPWSTYYSIKQYPVINSVYIKKGDTTFFQLNY
ncbi:MAG: hypothetical protein JNN28_21150 [Saprospiraceae bacterium]|nr:hypothetical protein [Saprospiraceae bacterium]